MNQSIKMLGDVVRERRKDRNLSQEALAKKIGVCKRTIINIEKNINNLKFEILCMLVRELDLPLYQVFYPEIAENLELKTMSIQELGSCSEHEMRIILFVVKNLRDILKKKNYKKHYSC